MYDDDQPQVAWDDQGLLYHLINPQTALVASPLFDCSRFSGLHTYCSVSGNQVALFYDWYADPGGNILLAQRDIMIDTGLNNPAVFAIASLGPYVIINVEPQVSPSPYVPTLGIMLTNREHPLTAYPRYPDLGQFSPASIPASGTAIQVLDTIFGGPVRMYVNNGGTGVDYVLQYLDVNFVWRKMFETTVAASEIDYFDIVLPLTSCRWSVTNNSGTTANTGFTTRCIPNLAAV